MGTEATDATGEMTLSEQVTGEEHVVRALEGTMTVLDHELQVQRNGSQRVFALHASEIRRVQVDIEFGRPATIAVVPNSGTTEAHVLTVERSEFEVMTRAMLHLAIAIDDAGRTPTDE
jgi:hypothetical protein